MRILLVTVTVFLTAVAEAWLGNYLMLLPLTGCAVFYFTVSLGDRMGLFAALLGGALTELLYGRSIWLAAGLLPVYCFGCYWQRRQRTGEVALAAVPGLAVGLLVPAPLYLWKYLVMGWRRPDWMEPLVFIPVAMIFCAAWLPLTVWWLDRCAGRLGLPRYRERKE